MISLMFARVCARNALYSGRLWTNNLVCVSQRFLYKMTVVKEIHDDIIKSKEDKRLYRGLKLENDLKVLLISDPETDKAAAAMDVNVGQLSDPDDLPGLAHFLEHMLFLGTEKYPSENEYTKYLSENGGDYNAYTALEHTCFYFDVTPGNLTGALDRFAQFFLTPTFTESATCREVCAVNSENDKNIANDYWRLHQLEMSTSNPKHPFNRFGTGSKQTLDEIPKMKGINVREELLKFHDKWYSSNIMSLCVLGKETLDELQDMVVSLFSGVVNKNCGINEWPEHPFGPNELKQMAKVVPIKDLRNLNIVFPIPDFQEFYKSAPANYVGHLIGHEGEGSLLSELKKKGWVNSLYGGLKSGAKGFAFFIVSVTLTVEGLQHINEIITNVFQYLNVLRREGPQQWVFDEVAGLNSLMFHFKDKERPISYVSNNTQSLFLYPFKEVLSGGLILSDYRPDLIQTIMDHLVPDNMRVAVTSKVFEGKTDLKEKWYGTDYSIERLSEDLLEQWRNVGDNPSLYLPAKNEFIPSNLELCTREESTNAPIVIRDTPLTRVWYKQDEEFLLPKSVLYFEFFTPMAYLDPLRSSLVYMLGSLLKDSLTEYVYAAELAGLHYELHHTQYGLFLSVYGYSDKQSVLLSKILDKMVNFKIDPQRFNILKESYVRGLRNFNAEQPHSHASYYTSILLSEHAWANQDYLDSVDDVTVERLEQFMPDLLSQLHIESLMHGNLTRKKAEEIIDMVEGKFKEKFSVRPVLPIMMLKDRQFCLTSGCNLKFEQTNAVHCSSCLETYYQFGLRNTQSNALIELFAQIISEPCFNILRTQEQLGYIVFSGVRRSNGAQGLRVLVQSHKKPSYLDQRVEAYLSSVKKYIEDMAEEELEKHKNALATRKMEKPKRLKERSAKYWGEIMAQEYFFGREKSETDYLLGLNKQDLLSFYDEIISCESSSRRKLSVHIISTAEKSQTTQSQNDVVDGLVPAPQLPEASVISDVLQFKSSLGLFPRAQPHMVVGPNAKAKL